MLTADRMAEVDRNAAALGVPRAKLMESSGNAVARVVREHAEPGASVTLLCGRGNNGGDAFVAARFLDEFDVRVVLLGRPETISTEIARDNWAALQTAEIQTRQVRDGSAFRPGDSSVGTDTERDGDTSGSADAPASDGPLADADVVVDALLGTGVTGALREPAATAARAVNRVGERGATVLSVDVPSGVDADTGEAAGVAVEPDAVVTFHDTKPGLRERAGDDAFAVTVADIGIPAAAERFVGPGDLRPLGRRRDSHKGDHGEVLVVGGGPYTGAPTLAARAALRAGADLVRVAVPESIAREVQGFDESLIVRPFDGDRLGPETVETVLDLAEEQDTVVLGPGLGDAPETLTAVETFLERYDGTAVVDAEATRLVPEVTTDATLVCTPHRGEFAAMGGDPSGDWETRAAAVEWFAAGLDADTTLLVKGPADVISDGETTRASRTGNPSMTVGGTGDVLAGVAGALAAVVGPVRGASLAAWANGRAGDSAAETYGDGLVATDLLPALPSALRDDGLGGDTGSGGLEGGR